MWNWRSTCETTLTTSTESRPRPSRRLSVSFRSLEATRRCRPRAARSACADELTVFHGCTSPAAEAARRASKRERPQARPRETYPPRAAPEQDATATLSGARAPAPPSSCAPARPTPAAPAGRCRRTTGPRSPCPSAGSGSAGSSCPATLTFSVATNCSLPRQLLAVVGVEHRQLLPSRSFGSGSDQ